MKRCTMNIHPHTSHCAYLSLSLLPTKKKPSQNKHRAGGKCGKHTHIQNNPFFNVMDVITRQHTSYADSSYPCSFPILPPAHASPPNHTSLLIHYRHLHTYYKGPLNKTKELPALTPVHSLAPSYLFLPQPVCHTDAERWEGGRREHPLSVRALGRLSECESISKRILPRKAISWSILV